jgi:hypothetical protein
MRKILAKVDRIRGNGKVTLDLQPEHPWYPFNGKCYELHSMGTPDVKCRITILINGVPVDLTIDDVY